MAEGIWIVEVDGVPVRMRQDTPEPKPLVGACVVQDVEYVRLSELQDSQRAFLRACEDAQAGPLLVKLNAARSALSQLESAMAHIKASGHAGSAIMSVPQILAWAREIGWQGSPPVKP